jgi:Ca-activated chloride channel family protein
MRGAAFATAPLAFIALSPFLLGAGLLESRNAEVDQGNAALKAGKAEEALGHYDKALAKLPADAGAHFDRGDALYALSRFDEAGQEFLRATQGTDPGLKASAFLNLGNAFVKKEKYKEAVEAYKRTLALRPDDQAAKWNLEVALAKKKDEEKKQQDKKNDDKQKQDQKKQSQNDKNDDKKNDDKKDDKQADKQPDKNDQKQQKDQPGKDKSAEDKKQQDAEKQNPQKDQGKPPQPADEKEIQAVLDNLERSSKDLEKERARLRAVRRAPPAKDW